jgi:hypothetical protein
MWFWGDEWQRGEREVDDFLASGKRGPVYTTFEDLKDHLERLPREHATRE